MKSLLGIILTMIFTACTNNVTNFKVDSQTHRATSYNERVRFVVLHYTAGGDEGSIGALTGPNVSTHYLVTSKASDPIYNMLPEEKRGWHAGISEFQGRTNLNDTSIGIEIVNLGYKVDGGSRRFYTYDEAQILKVVALLKDLVLRYDIEPTRVVGHSDIAPDRKHDPGPLFPWERLYREYKIGAWYDKSTYLMDVSVEEYEGKSIKDIQRLFRSYGYPMMVNGEWTKYNEEVLRAFQMHFRSLNYSGEIDLETYAIIKSLNKKYKN